jgi:hypothetical protein
MDPNNRPKSENALRMEVREATPEDREAAAAELGITLSQLNAMLAFLDAMRAHCEREHVDPEVAINTAIAFLSSAIESGYDEGTATLHIDAAKGLLACVGLTFDSVRAATPGDFYKPVH